MSIHTHCSQVVNLVCKVDGYVVVNEHLGCCSKGIDPTQHPKVTFMFGTIDNDVHVAYYHNFVVYLIITTIVYLGLNI